jgi:predicted dehydrogenase
VREPPVRVALLGVGRFGRRLLPQLQSRFDLAICCSRGSAGTAAWLSRNHPDLEYTTSVERVLDDPAIEAVAVATPIETHAEIAEAALLAGKHVFVEKPLADSLVQAEALAARSRNLDLVLFVGHQYLYHPALARLRAETGDDVAFAHLNWRKLGTFDSDLFWNLGSHEVSIALALMGEAPLDVELLVGLGVVSGCDIAVVRLGFDGGRQVVIDIDRTAPRRDKLVTVVGPGRRFLWHDDSLLELGAGGELTQILTAPDDPGVVGLELDAFAEAVERRAPYPSDAAHGAAVVEVIERIRSSVPVAA